RRLRSEKINPVPGMQIEISGRPAVIRSVGAGRVQVDFNPALAGKTLEYNITLRKVLNKKKGKMEALLHRRFPSIEQTKFKTKTTKRRITLTIPEEAFLVGGLQYAKQGFFTDLKRYLPGFKELVFEEVYMVEEKRATKPKDEEKPTESSDEGE
ncbi:MAG: hypothetical protein JSW01_00005, partial [Candidatus Bathyarchaeota archaeon]